MSNPMSGHNVKAVTAFGLLVMVCLFWAWIVMTDNEDTPIVTGKPALNLEGQESMAEDMNAIAAQSQKFIETNLAMIDTLPTQLFYEFSYKVTAFYPNGTEQTFEDSAWSAPGKGWARGFRTNHDGDESWHMRHSRLVISEDFVTIDVRADTLGARYWNTRHIKIPIDWTRIETYEKEHVFIQKPGVRAIPQPDGSFKIVPGDSVLIEIPWNGHPSMSIQ